jgi:hypothetical protein
LRQEWPISSRLQENPSWSSAERQESGLRTFFQDRMYRQYEPGQISKL